MADTLGIAASNLLTYLQNPAVLIVAHLGKNPIAKDVAQILLTDLVECDFPGYAPVPIKDWEIVEEEGDDYAEALSPEIYFQAATIVTAQQIFSTYLTISEGSNPPVLFQANLLDQPVTIDTEDQAYGINVRFSNAELPE